MPTLPKRLPEILACARAPNLKSVGPTKRPGVYTGTDAGDGLRSKHAIRKRQSGILVSRQNESTFEKSRALNVEKRYNGVAIYPLWPSQKE
jgi:hypothetical protein